MFVLKTKSTIAEDRSEVYVEFLNATGAYDADSNTGGFGAPNPARNTLAVLIFAEHQLSTENIEATISAYNPLTVSSFTIAMEKAKNGILYHGVLALPIFDDQLTYENGDVVFDNENPSDAFVKKMVDDEWEEVDLKDLVEDTTVYQAVEYSFPIADAELIKKNLLAEKLQKLRDYVYDECGEDEYKVLRDRYEYIHGLIRAASDDFCSEYYAEAQLKIEEVFNFETKVLNG
jgi:hypothetical protein